MKHDKNYLYDKMLNFNDHWHYMSQMDLSNIKIIDALRCITYRELIILDYSMEAIISLGRPAHLAQIVAIYILKLYLIY